MSRYSDHLRRLLHLSAVIALALMSRKRSSSSFIIATTSYISIEISRLDCTFWHLQVIEIWSRLRYSWRVVLLSSIGLNDRTASHNFLCETLKYEQYTISSDSFAFGIFSSVGNGQCIFACVRYDNKHDEIIALGRLANRFAATICNIR